MHPHLKRVIEGMMGPTGSVIIHVVIIVILIKLVFFAPPTKDPEVEVLIMEPESADLDEIQQELKELEEVTVVDAIAPPDVSLEPDVPMEEVEEFPAAEPDVDFSSLEVVDSVRSPLVLRGLYSGRSDAGRQGALRAFAGRWGHFTEAAVIKALDWLKRNQNADGSWDEGSQAAMTALGLLTFLSHGETPTSEDYGPTVEKAMRFLVDTQNDDGTWPKRMAGPNYVYGHGMATYAVSEAYGLTRVPALKQAMERAVAVIVDGQQAGGGWDYFWKKTSRRDTSVSGWQVQALKAASIAGCEVPGLQEAMDKAIADLKAWQNPNNGKFAYSNNLDTGTDGVTGVAVLCMQLTGHAEDEACEYGLQYLYDRALEVRWADNTADWDLYGWYYITQAKFHHGKKWAGWNSTFAKAFVESQNEDGSWLPPGHEAKRGLVYGTTFAALTLQVYYRLLPTYQKKAVEAPDDLVEDLDDEEELIRVI